MKEYPKYITIANFNLENISEGEDFSANVWYTHQDQEDETEYIRADLVPQWKPIPVDKDGFGLWGSIPKHSVIEYRDGTMFLSDDMDGDLAGDIETYASRYRYMEIPTFNE